MLSVLYLYECFTSIKCIFLDQSFYFIVFYCIFIRYLYRSLVDQIIGLKVKTLKVNFIKIHENYENILLHFNISTNRG